MVHGVYSMFKNEHGAKIEVTVDAPLCCGKTKKFIEEVNNLFSELCEDSTSDIIIKIE